MRKAVSYARFSSVNQSENSIQDQQRNIKQYAEREGILIIQDYADLAISGSDNTRPQYLAIKDQLSQSPLFDCVIVDSLDRLSRDTVEMEQFIRTARYNGTEVIAVSDGFNSSSDDSFLNGAIRGVFAQAYVEDLKKKTHRGMKGIAIKGQATGGKTYGYKSEICGEDTTYAIDETEAEVIREIFNQYSNGVSAKKIALYLNNKGIPSPRGKGWSHSTILGSAEKHSGILRNERYIGNFIWNKTEFRKNPHTGKRTPFKRPKSEWVTHKHPELAIIDDITWQKVKRRLDATTKANANDGRKAKKKHNFKYAISSLIQCAECGGWYSKISGQRFGCGRHYNKGASSCANSKTYSQSDLERIIFKVAVSARNDSKFLESAYNHYKKLHSQVKPDDTENQLRSKISTIENDLEKLMAALLSVGLSSTIAEKIKQLEEQKELLKFELSEIAKPTDEIKPLERKEFFTLAKDLMGKFNYEWFNSEPEQARLALLDLFGVLTIDSNTHRVGSNGSGGRI